MIALSKALERPTPASLGKNSESSLESYGVENLRHQNIIKYKPRWHLSNYRTEAHELFRVLFILGKE